MIPYRVYGIKYGSGGGSSGGGEPFGRTLLYDCGNFNIGAPYQTETALLDNLSNYDFIMLLTGANGDDASTDCYISDTAMFDVASIMASADKTIRQCAYDTRQIIIRFTDTTFTVTHHTGERSGQEQQLYRIYGYKMGSGGGSSGGGGTPTKRTVLYDSGGYNTYAPYQQDVSLLDNLSNYDVIAIVAGTQNDNTAQSGYRYLSEFFDVPMIQASKTVFLQSIVSRFGEIEFTDTTFNIVAHGCPGESSGYELQVYKIIGYKYGSGGGGGTPTGLGDLAYKDSASGTAVTNVEYDENTHRITITLGTVTVS